MKRFCNFFCGRVPALWHSAIEALFMLPFGHAAALNLALFALVAILDYLTPPQLNLTFLYAFLVMIAAWNTNLRFVLLFVAMAFAMQVLMVSGFKGLYSGELFFYVSLGNRLFTFLLAAALIMPLKAMHARERSIARIDFTTGIANRQAFRERLEAEISRRDREGFPFSMAYLDADNFKVVNDRAGHEQGDRALAEIARAIGKAIRKTDYLARLGGDEFGVLFHHSDLDVARRVLDRVRKGVAESMAAHNWPITLSAGLGTFDTAGLSPDTVMNYCDGLLYGVKREGKNDVAHGRYFPDKGEARHVAARR